MTRCYFQNPDDPTSCLCGHRLEYYRKPDRDPKRHDCPINLHEWLDANSVDLLCTESGYWKQIYKRIREEQVGLLLCDLSSIPAQDWRRYSPTLNKDLVIKKLKYLKGLAREEEAGKHRESPITQYGEEIGETVYYFLRKAMKGLSCCDNLRWARVGNSADRRWYAKRRDKGCCGFVDTEVDTKYGRFLIGFNYGH